MKQCLKHTPGHAVLAGEFMLEPQVIVFSILLQRQMSDARHNRGAADSPQKGNTMRHLPQWGCCVRWLHAQMPRSNPGGTTDVVPCTFCPLVTSSTGATCLSCAAALSWPSSPAPPGSWQGGPPQPNDETLPSMRSRFHVAVLSSRTPSRTKPPGAVWGRGWLPLPRLEPP